MLIGFQSSRPFWWRRRRRSAGPGKRPAPATPELGAWRRPPPAAAATRPGNAQPAVVAAAGPASGPPAELVLEQARPGNARPAVVAAAAPAAAPASGPPAEVVLEQARSGNARPAVVAAAAPAAAPASGPAAELVLEQVRPDAAELDPSRGRARLLEQLRPACRALSAAAFAAPAGDRDRLILVTSPSAGEGKSSTAVNLALGLSRRDGRPVLLVDADGRTAGAARSLGWPPRPGLWDVLAGELELEGLIGHTGLDDLWFLPPGGPLAAMPELLAGRRLPEVMRALLLRASAGLVVIDGPPLLSSGAAAALAACAGQVVLMVAAGRTSQQALDDSLRRLGARRHLHGVFARPASPVRRARAATG